MHRPSLCVSAYAAFSFALLVLSNGCIQESSDTSVKAYIAPASVNVRSQLSQKNMTVATLKHGERVSVLDVRRRFVKIRTSKGAEGWVDSLDLLNAAAMERISLEHQQALSLPPEGSATAYETLNIHLEPNRKSPAFTQIPEGGSVAVLGHKIAPRAGDVRPPTFTLEHPPAPARRQRKERAPKNILRLPPAPPPPKPPAGWQHLLGGGQPLESSEYAAAPKTDKRPEAAARKAEQAKKPLIMEDWTLVRTLNNLTGWVLSRNLMMSIPDEVAQYAEGKHITSFFQLGSVNDELKGEKHDWLWTTISAAQPFDFDSWRVFLWNRHRHRYETSYRQREIEGYFPVHADPPPSGAAGATFQLITKDEDGKFRRRSYLFDGTRVHLTGTEEYQPESVNILGRVGQLSSGNAPKAPRTNWLKGKWGALKERLFGAPKFRRSSP